MADIIETVIEAIAAIFIIIILIFAILPALSEIGADPTLIAIGTIAGILFIVAIILSLFKR
jgi:hypothetical protein